MNKLQSICLIILLNSTAVMAADSPNLKLFGTLLVPPPCVISNDERIEVFLVRTSVLIKLMVLTTPNR